MDMSLIAKVAGAAAPVKVARVSIRKKPKVVQPKTKTKAKPKAVAKVRIRAYSPEYYEWIAKPEVHLEPVAEFSQYKPVQECNHPQCVQGRYVNGAYNRECFRCKGKGTMTQADINRLEARNLAEQMGVTKTTYASQANPNWAYNLA